MLRRGYAGIAESPQMLRLFSGPKDPQTSRIRQLVSPDLVTALNAQLLIL